MYPLSRERAHSTVKYRNGLSGGKHTENMEIVLI